MNNIFVAFSIVGAAAVAPAMAVAAPYTVHGSVLDAMTMRMPDICRKTNVPAGSMMRR